MRLTMVVKQRETTPQITFLENLRAQTRWRRSSGKNGDYFPVAWLV
jgi:hypothetical protein